ncbi:hypothetical protein LSTR_LSTR014350 [Laodelphax striatellus]|uniref:Uncharacterized protein n=1 Tax=Laodelphax striatellus TaxID=195883 RepID=A0A482XNZ4_LAOST|nr:hypothetical protein LSTR_LSTR014350 [Laodelphax striatellus]
MSNSSYRLVKTEEDTSSTQEETFDQRCTNSKSPITALYSIITRSGSPLPPTFLCDPGSESEPPLGPLVLFTFIAPTRTEKIDATYKDLHHALKAALASKKLQNGLLLDTREKGDSQTTIRRRKTISWARFSFIVVTVALLYSVPSSTEISISVIPSLKISASND